MEVLKSWCIPALRLISFSTCASYLLVTWNRKMTIAGMDQINAFRLISGFIQSAQNRSKSPLSSFQVSTLVILNKFLLNYCLQESLWQMPEAGRSPRRHPGWLPTTANGWWQSGKESLYRILLCARVHHTRWPSSGLLC